MVKQCLRKKRELNILCIKIFKKMLRKIIKQMHSAQINQNPFFNSERKEYREITNILSKMKPKNKINLAKLSNLFKVSKNQ